MAFPKKIKKDIQLIPDKELLERRKELLGYIQDKGTYLPKPILHGDLDRGMLDFVKEKLLIVSNGKTIDFIDIILSSQNWSQYTETWSFMNDDLNAEPPFVTVVRTPEMKYGTNPSLNYTIPNRKTFYYTLVKNWDGQRKGADVYQIPQPVPIDINYKVYILTNRLIDLNSFNKTVLQIFSSRQAYQTIKGHFIPIVMNGISDESSLSIESRKFFLQSYDFTMLGFLLDEEEFKIKPAVSRVLQVYETDLKTPNKKVVPVDNEIIPELNVSIAANETSKEESIKYSARLDYVSSENVSSFDVYINNDYYGSDVEKLYVSNSDVLRLDVTKISAGISNVKFKIVI